MKDFNLLEERKDNVGCYELGRKALTCSPKEEVECVAHSRGSFRWSDLPYKKAV